MNSGVKDRFAFGYGGVVSVSGKTGGWSREFESRRSDQFQKQIKRELVPACSPLAAVYSRLQFRLRQKANVRLESVAS